MIKVIKISTIIFVLFIIGAPSCEDEQETANRELEILSAAKNDIRREFETEYLTEASLFAYETTAKQKLSDLADYLHIMTDTTLEMSFRNKAGEMIRKSFISENVDIDLFEPGNGSVERLKVHQLIKKGLENKLSSWHFSYDSIRISKPLKRVDNTMYKGILRYVLEVNEPVEVSHIDKSISKCIDFYVTKDDKVFGNDSLKIWNVCLGEIR